MTESGKSLGLGVVLRFGASQGICWESASPILTELSRSVLAEAFMTIALGGELGGTVGAVIGSWLDQYRRVTEVPFCPRATDWAAIDEAWARAAAKRE